MPEDQNNDLAISEQSSLTEEEEYRLGKTVPTWTVLYTGIYLLTRLLKKRFLFKNYLEGISFLQTVGTLAAGEGCFPVIRIDNHTVDIEIRLPALTKNPAGDFILARKIDALTYSPPA